MDGAAGVLPAGLAQPTISATSSAGKDNRFIADGVAETFLHSRQVSGDLATAYYPDYDLIGLHRGVPPAVGASSARLDLIAGSRKWGVNGATVPVVQSAPMFVSAAVQYRPRFTFLKGL